MGHGVRDVRVLQKPITRWGMSHVHDPLTEHQFELDAWHAGC